MRRVAEPFAGMANLESSLAGLASLLFLLLDTGFVALLLVRVRNLGLAETQL